MTKNEEKNLVWKLKDLPDATEIASLVEQEVITAKEARQILFSEKTDEEIENEQIEALKEQIKFLQNVVDKLASQPPQTVFRYIDTYRPAKIWMSTSTPTPYKVVGQALMSNLTSGAQGTMSTWTNGSSTIINN